MKLLKFAAIDIGTNAARLLLANVIEDKNETFFKKSSLVRSPLRLGDHVFEYKEIREPKIEKLMQTMLAFRELMKVNEVVKYRACATSAMREAQNGAEIIHRIKKEIGIDIEIITGSEEADIIYSTQINKILNREKTYLYVDVGGGSTELTLYTKGKIKYSHSFKIGTIRLLKNQVSTEEMIQLKNKVQEMSKDYKQLEIIGTGGNINKIFKFSGKKEGKYLSHCELSDIFEEISSYNYDERMKVLGFNPDRADVIIPAAKLFIDIMDWSNSRKLNVPKIGLSDGIIRLLYDQYKSELSL